MLSWKNLLRTLADRRRSIEVELAEAPKWRAWRQSPWSISDSLRTKGQASRPISESSNLQPYIVHVDLPPSSSNDLLSYYQTFLPKTTADEESRIIYAYNIISGFAASLSPEEVKAMEKIPGFISARVSGAVHFCSTHSNQNMGLLKDSNYGEGVIMSGWKSKWGKGSQIRTEEENRGEETNSSS